MQFFVDKIEVDWLQIQKFIQMKQLYLALHENSGFGQLLASVLVTGYKISLYFPKFIGQYFFQYIL